MHRGGALAAIGTAAALAFAGVAGAHGGDGGKRDKGKHAKVLRATLAHGKAQLVDGRKRNKISIHVRGLTPGTTYTWHIHKAASRSGDPCMPAAPVVTAPYGDWVYGTLMANAAGNASAKGRSATFDSRADPGPFFVDVHLSDGTVVACGALTSKHGHDSKHATAMKPVPRSKDDSEGQDKGHKPSHDGSDDKEPSVSS